MARMYISMMLEKALAAAKRSSVWVYRNRYTTGAKTITKKAPCEFSRNLTQVTSHDYAREAGVSTSTALRHLRKLSVRGLLIEVPRSSANTTVTFRLRKEDSERIGREIIRDLQADGLPFDIDWRRAKHNV